MHVYHRLLYLLWEKHILYLYYIFKFMHNLALNCALSFLNCFSLLIKSNWLKLHYQELEWRRYIFYSHTKIYLVILLPMLLVLPLWMYLNEVHFNNHLFIRSVPNTMHGYKWLSGWPTSGFAYWRCSQTLCYFISAFLTNLI